MATFAAAHAKLCRLRRDIARIEGRLADDDRLAETAFVGSVPGDVAAEERMRRKSGGRLALGIAALDAVLGGGLPLAALTEIRAAQSRDGGVVSGFSLALLAQLLEKARGSSSIVWIGEADLRRETGALYAPGLVALRPRSCPRRRSRRSHGDGGALGIRGGSLMSWRGRGGLRAAECIARSLRYTPLCASRPRERGHRPAAPPRKRMGGTERGRNPLPRRPGAGRRNRRFRQRRRPYGLVPDLGEEPSGTDRCLHGGVGCS